jgi:hypothetical protein
MLSSFAFPVKMSISSALSVNSSALSECGAGHGHECVHTFHYPHCNPLWKISWEVWIEDLDIIRVLDLVDVTAKLFELLPKPGCHHCQSLVAKYENEDAVHQEKGSMP